MKVQLFVSKNFEESHAEIYTDVLTDNIQKAMYLLENVEDKDNNFILSVKRGQDIIPLDFEIFL